MLSMEKINNKVFKVCVSEIIMVKREANQKVCFECSKYIDIKKDHHIQMHNLNKSISPDTHTYFHYSCFVDFFNKTVENKMKSNLNGMQEKAMNLFNSPIVQNSLSQISGLHKTDPVLSQEIKLKLKNGKRKRSGKKARISKKA
jgi:hypothetical protein